MTNTSTPNPSPWATPPRSPDPIALTDALAATAAAAREAMEASARRMAEGAADPLPYDASAVARAFADYSLQLAQRPDLLWAQGMKNAADWAQLWGSTARRALGQDAQPVIEPEKGDRRFKDSAWSDDLAFDTLKQSYLLAARQAVEMVSLAGDMGPAARQRVDFFTRQAVAAAAPTNYAATNPAVIRQTAETGGLNLVKGAQYFLNDVAGGQGIVTRRSAEDFEVGRNIACTPGSVVFQNELMQLIQYAPSTQEVRKRPLLFVPPVVNKYYLFDLTPKSSFLKWLVDQGHTVFVISWVNPDLEHAHKDFAAYLKEGPLAALDAIEQATGERTVDLVAYCLGGTLSAATLAYLQATGQGDRVATATLVATLLDFSDMGEWSTFIDDEQMAAFDRYLDAKGYVEAHDLTKLFSVVRANDLIWSSVVNHYLMGEEAAPSDLLYWFADGARIPAGMLKSYGRAVLQQNKLREPGGVLIDDVALDLSKVTTPVTIVSLKDDHVAGWQATYEGTKLFGAPVTFMLGGSGHNAGTINPPAANKHGFWTSAETPETAEQWLEGAEKHPGSWWPTWRETLDADNPLVPARAPGDGDLPVVEPAPGSYAMVRH